MNPKELAAAHDRLAESLKTARDLNESYKSEISQVRCALNNLCKENDETKAQFSDLKTRLLSAERANEFMRGYLARVTEDDQVREELVAVGDPMGEQHLVPKRRSTTHPRPSDFLQDNSEDGRIFHSSNRDRPRAKHWITY